MFVVFRFGEVSQAAGLPLAGRVKVKTLVFVICCIMCTVGSLFKTPGSYLINHEILSGSY